MTVLIPNSILNILLEGRVGYILGNIDLKISNTQPRLKKTIAYKKKACILPIMNLNTNTDLFSESFYFIFYLNIFMLTFYVILILILSIVRLLVLLL